VGDRLNANLPGDLLEVSGSMNHAAMITGREMPAKKNAVLRPRLV
jgi:hypothetical protein